MKLSAAVNCIDQSLPELVARTPALHEDEINSDESSEEDDEGEHADYQETADDSTGSSAS